MMKKIFILLLMIMTYFIGFIEGESLRAEEVIERPTREIPNFLVFFGSEFVTGGLLGDNNEIIQEFPTPNNSMPTIMGAALIDKSNNLLFGAYNINTVGTWSTSTIARSWSYNLNSGQMLSSSHGSQVGISDGSVAYFVLPNQYNGAVFSGFRATNTMRFARFPNSTNIGNGTVLTLSGANTNDYIIRNQGQNVSNHIMTFNNFSQRFYVGSFNGLMNPRTSDIQFIGWSSVPIGGINTISSFSPPILVSYENKVFAFPISTSDRSSRLINVIQEFEISASDKDLIVNNGAYNFIGREIEGVISVAVDSFNFYFLDLNGSIKVMNRNNLLLTETIDLPQFLGENILHISYFERHLYIFAEGSPLYKYNIDSRTFTQVWNNTFDRVSNAHLIISTVEANLLDISFNSELGSISGLAENGFYFTGDEVSLRANPRLGYRFVSWSGDVFSSNRNLNITMPSADLNIQANFEPIPQGEVIPEESLTSRMFSFIDSSDLAPMFVFSMVAIFVIALVFLLGGSFTTALTVGMAILGFFVSIGLLPIWTILAVFIFLLVLLINVFRGGK